MQGSHDGRGKLVDTRNEPRYEQRPGLETIEIDGEISIFDGIGLALMLNQSASMIWAALGRNDTATAVALELAPMYGEEPYHLRPAVQTALSELVDLGVVELIG